MKRIIGYIAIAVLLTSTMIGCSVIKSAKAPEPLPVAQDQIPLDASLAATAIMCQICDASMPDRMKVRFKPNLRLAGEPSLLRYRGFSITRHQLYSYNQHKEKPGRRMAHGLLDLTSPLGRKAKLAYKVFYSLDKQSILIERYELQPVYAQKPAVEVMAIPVRTVLQKKDSNQPLSWDELYLAAKPYNLLPLGDDIGPVKDQQLLVLVFVKDQMPPSDGITLLLADKKDSRAYYGLDKYSRYVDNNGWRVAMVSGRFLRCSPDPLVFKLTRSSKGGGWFGSSHQILLNDDLWGACPVKMAAK